ncbi:hypothetical protein BN2475_710035 [Paraburkholderia ribeironis]|uniref:Uncharacterized protein n=1 Tax=Paraburkholderia ribeironis TaxID=1247936 RepID=A0A1N7SJA0_9BURK|nr:hypothetical protein BN2475_710035 [Paraburkholderia ribeironis]
MTRGVRRAAQVLATHAALQMDASYAHFTRTLYTSASHIRASHPQFAQCDRAHSVTVLTV